MWTGCEVSRKLRIADFKSSAHEGVKFVGPKQRPLLPLRACSWYSLQCHSAAGSNRSMKNSNGTIGNRTRVLPVPHQTAPPHAPDDSGTWDNELVNFLNCDAS